MTARIVDRTVKTGAILRAAAQVFAEQGYQAATMDGIAERAGIGKGTVYEYFRNKQDLFFAVFDDYIASMERLVRQSLELPSGTVAFRIQQMIHAALAVGAEGRDLFPLVFEFWSASASPDRQARVATLLRDTYAKFRRLIADQIRRGQQEGVFDRTADAARIAAVLVGALDGLFLQAWFDPTLDPVPMGDDFVAVLLRGLSSPEKTGRHTPRRESPRKGTKR
ncbi:MAG TPA: TetR/AcrR family transcriptional regulator [Bryobacteraceae bacterium]|jgi:AcrR family transcriptional regulator|nr:TetR/AcrR family transcriptional regulator [Bryobacteraceae bacterium]